MHFRLIKDAPFSPFMTIFILLPPVNIGEKCTEVYCFLQGTVSSLQALVGGLNTKMAAFSGMFRKVDEQLMDMWTVSMPKIKRRTYLYY